MNQHRMRVHLINPSHVSFGVGVITPRRAWEKSMVSDPARVAGRPLTRDRLESFVERDDLLDDQIARPLTRTLAVGLPHRAERAVLRTSAHGLDGRPHIPVVRHQIPSPRQQIRRLDLTTLIGIHTGNALRGYELGILARAAGATVVCGGIHATLFPEDARDLGGANAVVKGDGDRVWGQVSRLSRSRTASISWRSRK
jgi:hypothetical protein